MLVDFILHKANGTDTVELNKSIDGYSVVLNPKLHDVYNQVSYVEFDVAMSMDNYIEIGDWIEVDGKKYYSLTNFASFNARIAKGGTYNVRFYSPEQWLYKANMYATNEIYSGGVYSWERVDNTIVTVGNLESFGRWLCWNTNAQQNTRMFKLGNVPTGMNEQYEVLDFNPANCLSALYSICKTYKVRYEVVPNTEASPDSQYIINFYDTDEVFPVTFKYEEENGLYKLELTGCDEEVYTQFEIAGSTENIPSSYRDTRLRLSESISALSILDYPDLYDKWGRSIKILTYENIKPTRTGTVTDIVVDDIYSFIDSSLIGATWSPVGGTIQIVEGPLMGFSFECDYFNSANGRVHIKPMTESNGMELPSADLSYYRFTAGATPTRYNVVGIALPNEYIEDAEARLLAAAMNDTSYYSDIRASYSLAISGTLLEEGEYEINAGVLVPIQHLGIGLDRSVRVQSITYDLSKPKYYDIEEIQLSDFRQEGLMDMVTEGVRKSVATLKDVGYTNKLNTFANSVSTIKQGIAKSLGYESWEDFMEKTWNGEDGSWEPSTIIVDSLINSDLINVNTLIAREAFISTLLANELFISGVQDETESLVNNYLLYLTSSVATVSCDSEGTVTGTLPTSTAIVYHGASADTGWSFSGEFSGCTGSVNSSTGIITITGLTADNSTVTVSATKTNKPTLQAIFRISKVYAGIDGIDGEDGVTTYTWIKYSDNADGTGLYDTPTANTLYIGIAVNKTTATESTVKTDYVWSKFKGEQGNQGIQGIPGTPGADGVTYYTWVKYADTPTTGMSDYPSGKAYLGIAYNKTTATESENYADYSWSLIKGTDGQPGADGADGQTLYTWIKYADTPTSGMSDSPTGKTYIGIAVNKTTSVESSTYADYTWSLIKGTDGIDGIDGVDGADSVMYYLTPSVDAVIRSMDGTATPSTVSCAQYKIQGGGTPVAANKTIKYQRSIDGTMQTYSTAVAVSTSIYIDFYLYDGVTELWRTRVPVLHDLDEWESTLNDFAKGLGYTDTVGGDSAYEKLVGAALAGKTIMEGGYLRNSLIDTEHLIAHDAFINRIATNSLTIGKITDTAAALDDAIQIGGRNLLRNSGVTVQNSSYVINMYRITKAIPEGTQVTVTIEGVLAPEKERFMLLNSGGNVGITNVYHSDEVSAGVYRKTFNWIVGASTNINLCIFTGPNTVVVTSTINRIKLEVGNKATDWTPAPEDVQEDYATKFGYSSYSALVAQAAAGLTIIDGGHLRTSLIDADAVIANIAHIGGVSIGENKLYVGSGNYGNADTGFYLGSDAKFSLKDKLTFDGTDLMVNGGGTFTGKISVGGVLIGKDAFGSGLHGIKLNAYNYWYLDGANAKVKFGGETNYISWDGTTLKQNGAAIGGGSIVGTSIDIPNATTPLFKVTAAGVVTAKSGTIGGVTIESTKMYLGTTGTYGNANTPFYVDTSNRFSLGSKLKFASGVLTIDGGGTFSGALSAATGSFSGSLSAATGTFAGTVAIGETLKIGASVNGANNGLFINSNNYWYGSGALKIGGTGAYLSYESGALSMVGGSISAGSFTTTDGTTSVVISPTAVSGSSGVRVSNGNAYAGIGLSGSWPSVHISQGGLGTPGVLLTPGRVDVNDGFIAATLQNDRLSLSGLVFDKTNLGSGNVVKTSGGGFLRFGITVDNEDGSHKHNKISGYTVVIGTGSDPNTIYFSTT